LFCCDGEGRESARSATATRGSKGHRSTHPLALVLARHDLDAVDKNVDVVGDQLPEAEVVERPALEDVRHVVDLVLDEQRQLLLELKL
jgi:hypothetical protein